MDVKKDFGLILYYVDDVQEYLCTIVNHTTCQDKEEILAHLVYTYGLELRKPYSDLPLLRKQREELVLLYHWMKTEYPL